MSLRALTPPFRLIGSRRMRLRVMCLGPLVLPSMATISAPRADKTLLTQRRKAPRTARHRSTRTSDRTYRATECCESAAECLAASPSFPWPTTRSAQKCQHRQEPGCPPPPTTPPCHVPPWLSDADPESIQIHPPIATGLLSPYSLLETEDRSATAANSINNDPETT